MSLQQHIEKLKELTLNEKNLVVTVNYFLDHLAEDPSLTGHSNLMTEKHDFFKSLLNPILKNHYKNHIEVISLLLLKLQNSSLVHGVVQLSNHVLMTLYFFEDMQTGMAISISLPGQNDFFRLSVLNNPYTREAPPVC